MPIALEGKWRYGFNLRRDIVREIVKGFTQWEPRHAIIYINIKPPLV